MRILIIKLGALGDVVMATPLVAAIQAHHRSASCTLLTTPVFAPLFADWPGLQVVALPRRGVAAMGRILAVMRGGHYARVYDLQSNDRTRWLCALSGIPERIGNHPHYPYTHHPATPWRGQTHIFERMRALLASGGITALADTPLLPVDRATAASVSDWLEHHSLSERSFVILHAGASANRAQKRWPGFGALALRLQRAGLAVVWVGGEADRPLNQTLAREVGIDATACFTISALAELGRHARFAVTNDSGPMHVLSASGIPVFGLFGPSDWRRNHALGQAGRVIACVDIDPASRGLRHADCLAAVGVEEVWQRLVQAQLIET